MQNLIHDLRYAGRTLRRNPGFTAVAVLALALGIGANTAVFTVLNSVVLRPLPFPEPDRLFLVSYDLQHGPFSGGFSMVDSHYLEFRGQDRLFEHIATFVATSANLTGGGEPAHLAAANVTPDFFGVLRMNAAMGRTFLANENQDSHVAVLSDKLWRSRYGADPRTLGRTVTVDGVAHTVIGIMPAGFHFPYESELWTPAAIRLNPNNSFAWPVVGRLKPGVSREQAQAELETIMRRLPTDPRDERRDRLAQVVPLKELQVGKVKSSLWIFAGAVGFVLLIACANVANLLLARAAGRQQEMAVRRALGAARWRLVRLLLTESTLLSLAGGAAGILVALWGVPALIAMAPLGKIPRADEIHIDGWVLAFTAAVSLITGLLFGFAPALRATRQQLRETLSQGGRTVTGRNEGLRSALVVAEIALALVLLTGAGLLVKSFLRLRAVDPGFRAENVLTMTVELPDSVYRTAPDMQKFHEGVLARLAQLPGVLSAGAVNFSPLGWFLTKGDFQIEGGRKLPPGFLADKLCVSPGYFRAMGIRFESGRDFSARDRAGAPAVAIVSKSVAERVFPGEDPIGKRISEQDHPKPEDWVTIIGIVDDVRQMGLDKNPDPATYYPYLQAKQTFWLDRMTFAVRTASNPQQLAPAFRSVLHQVDRNQPVTEIATMENVISSSTAEPRFQARLLSVFSMLALLLAAVGIYGVLAYSVAERTHEIGIRMALGAETGDVLRMVLRRTLLLAGAGVALGTVGALAVTRVLAKFLFEVKPADPATFAVVALALVGVAAAAGWIPARRATAVDPIVALRYE